MELVERKLSRYRGSLLNCFSMAKEKVKSVISFDKVFDAGKNLLKVGVITTTVIASATPVFASTLHPVSEPPGINDIKVESPQAHSDNQRAGLIALGWLTIGVGISYLAFHQQKQIEEKTKVE